MAWVRGCKHTPGNITRVRVSLTMQFPKIGFGLNWLPGVPDTTINYVSARVPKKRGIRHKEGKTQLPSRAENKKQRQPEERVLSSLCLNSVYVFFFFKKKKHKMVS